jgi:hypothetical protein
MKSIITFFGFSTSVVSLLAPLASSGQTFSLAMPLEVRRPFFDGAGAGGDYFVGEFVMPAGTLNETLTLDVAAKTLRITGTWDIPAFSVTNVFNETRTIGGNQITGTATVTITTTTSTTRTFDSGLLPLTPTGIGQHYSTPTYSPLSVLAIISSLSSPMTYTYSLFTGGNNHTVQRPGQQVLRFNMGMTDIDLGALPDSINALQKPFAYDAFGLSEGFSAFGQHTYTAPNGFFAQPRMAPEPTNLMLVALSGVLLSLRRWRRLTHS